MRILNFFKKNLRLILGILISALILYHFLFSDYGFVRKWKLEKEKKNLQAEIYREIHIRDSLKNLIRLLKFDTLEIERVARIKYGLIKEGEVTYVFGKKKAN